jgi:uncharacterized DUF497 family protein
LSKEDVLKISGLIWLDQFIEKLEQKHRIRQHEVRELFADEPKFRRIEKGHHPDEDVYSISGKSDSGRYLIVFYVYKNDARALIISGRDMTRSERKRYERK